MKIIIDKREPIDDMVPLLEKHDFEPEVKVLEAGDYFIPEANMVWSWKSHTDFLQSLYNNHLKDEIAHMYEHYDDKWLGLMVWKLKEGQKFVYGLSKKKFWRVKSTVEYYNTFYIPTFRVGQRETAVKRMKKYASKMKDKDYPIVLTRRVRIKQDNRPPMILLLQTINGVGEEIATQLYNEFKTVESLMIAIKETHDYSKTEYKTKKEWKKNVWYSDIEGCGKKVAEIIYESLFKSNE